MRGHPYAGGLFLTVSQNTIETLRTPTAFRDGVAIQCAPQETREERITRSLFHSRMGVASRAYHHRLPSGNVMVHEYGGLYRALERAAAGSGLKVHQLCGFATLSARGVLELDRTQIQVPSSCDISYCELWE